MEELYDGHKIFLSNGYPTIWKDGRQCRVHILQMEKKLKRKLYPQEVVHHKDENKTNYTFDNLICFASQKDHTSYHKGSQIYLDSNGIAHAITKTFKIEGKKGRYINCPICENIMSASSDKCMKCSQKFDHIQKYTNGTKVPSTKPKKKELQNAITLYKTYTAVGKEYGVTGNTVKKWAKQYNLYKPVYAQKPNRYELEKLLEKNSITAVSRHYGVSRFVVSNWIRYYGIIKRKTIIQCVETKWKDRLGV